MNTEDFISTVSHELRTPLTSIKGFAQTMLSSWDKLDENQKIKFVKIIEEQSERLITLIENVLTVSKAKDTTVLKAVNVVTVIQKVIQIIKQQYTTHKFITNLSTETPNVLADTNKLEQVLINLIENAAKYSIEDSTVTISTRIKDSYVAILVKDEGIGIPKDKQKDIFNKFSRLDNPLTRKTQGSGLGLYITKDLTEKMNGSISLESSEKGSTFEVLLPIATLENQAGSKCLPQS